MPADGGAPPSDTAPGEVAIELPAQRSPGVWSGRRMPLVSILWRVFAGNALVFGVALVVLVISPATVL